MKAAKQFSLEATTKPANHPAHTVKPKNNGTKRNGNKQENNKKKTPRTTRKQFPGSTQCYGTID